MINGNPTEKPSQTDYILGKISRLEKQLDHIEYLLCELLNQDVLVKTKTTDGTEVMIRRSSGKQNHKPISKPQKPRKPKPQEASLFDELDIPF